MRLQRVADLWCAEVFRSSNLKEGMIHELRTFCCGLVFI
jgi:hypothetical protein